MDANFKPKGILLVVLSYLSVASVAFGIGLLMVQMWHSQKRLAMEVEYGELMSETKLAGLVWKLRSDLAIEDFQFPLERLTESLAYKNLDHQLQEHAKALRAHEKFHFEHGLELGRLGLISLFVGLGSTIASSVLLHLMYSPGDRLKWSFQKRMQKQAEREAIPANKSI